MSDPADTGLAATLTPPWDDPRHARRQAIEAAYELTFERTIRHDTLAALENVVAWLDECRTSSLVVRTTVLRAVAEIGWRTGGGFRRDHSRTYNSLARRLNMLAEMGWIDSWAGVFRPDGMGDGIVIHLRRDSSVGRAIWRDHPPRQLSLLGPETSLDGPAPAAAAAARVLPFPAQRVSNLQAGRVSNLGGVAA